MKGNEVRKSFQARQDGKPPIVAKLLRFNALVALKLPHLP